MISFEARMVNRATRETRHASCRTLRMVHKALPRHIGFIPDGNRRWAQSRGMPKEAGYAFGIRPGLELFELCDRQGIQEVSVYGFTQDSTRRATVQTESFGLPVLRSRLAGLNPSRRARSGARPSKPLCSRLVLDAQAAAMRPVSYSTNSSMTTLMSTPAPQHWPDIRGLSCGKRSCRWRCWLRAAVPGRSSYPAPVVSCSKSPHRPRRHARRPRSESNRAPPRPHRRPTRRGLSSTRYASRVPPFTPKLNWSR